MKRFLILWLLLVVSLCASAQGPVFNTPSRIVTSTYTPVVSFGGASVGITYTFQSGRYTQFPGRACVDIAIFLSNNGSSTGAMAITLPVATHASSVAQTLAVRGNVFAATVTSTPQAYLAANGSSIGLEFISSGNAVAITDAHTTDTTQVILTGCYES